MSQGVPKITAIVPLKDPAQSKTRLAGVLSSDRREALVLGMLRQVLTAVRETGIDEYWVIGGETRVRGVAEELGAVWWEELGSDLNDTLRIGFEKVAAQGNSALYVAGDLPFLKASDLHSIVSATRRQSHITLAPARRDGGTNGILAPHGITFHPELGPRSFPRHLAKAAELGVSAAFCYSQGLALDLDIPEDLVTYQHMDPSLMARLTGE